MTADYMFTTLALAPQYAMLARTLAGDLSRHSPESKLLVLTTSPSIVEDCPNVIAIQHRQINVRPYHDKIFCVAEALRRSDHCIFVDADTRIVAPVGELELSRGVGAFLLRSWSYNRIESSNDARVVRIQDRLRSRFQLQEELDDLPYVVEYLFSVARSDRLDEFLWRWQRVALCCQRHRFFVHEGYAIAIAAMQTGIPLEQTPFPGLHFVTSNLRPESSNADLTDAEFQQVMAEIEETKHDSSRATAEWQRRLRLLVRWARVSALGMRPRRFPRPASASAEMA